MQEEVENKSVVLATNASKMTGRTLALLMRAALRKMREARNTPKQGKQSLKQLAKGGSLSTVEIKDDNIKAFDPIARKYNVSYSLKKDITSEFAQNGSAPRWLVFFRAKDADSMTAAFKEFSALIVKRDKDRPSTRKTMQKFRESIKNVVRDRTKVKHRDREER